MCLCARIRVLASFQRFSEAPSHSHCGRLTNHWVSRRVREESRTEQSRIEQNRIEQNRTVDCRKSALNARTRQTEFYLDLQFSVYFFGLLDKQTFSLQTRSRQEKR